MFHLFQTILKQVTPHVSKGFEKQTETYRLYREKYIIKLTKSSCFTCFEMFQNNIEAYFEQTESLKQEKVKILNPISGVLKH